MTTPQPNKQVQVMSKPDKQKPDTSPQPQTTVGSTTQIEHIPVTQTVPQ